MVMPFGDLEEAIEYYDKRIAQLEAENAALRRLVENYKLTIEEALPECWDTPKAEHILRECLEGVETINSFSPRGENKDLSENCKAVEASNARLREPDIWKDCVIDVTLDPHDPEIFNTRVFCFCPYEAETGTIVTGMSLITDWPENWKVVGIVHADGDETVEKWIEDNPEVMKIIEERRS